MRRLSLTVAFIVLATAALAQQIGVSPLPPTDHIISVKPLIEQIIPYLVAAFGAIITALAGMAVKYIHDKTGVEIDAGHREAIQTAATNMAALLIKRIEAKVPTDIHVGSQALADAANNAIAAVPDAVAHFGITPENMAEKVTAKATIMLAGAPAPAPVIVQAAPLEKPHA